jgi:hypothetical protein
MDHEELHSAHISEGLRKAVTNAHIIAECAFEIADQQSVYYFNVGIQIWQDKDWEYNEFRLLCERYITEHNLINNSSYKEIADKLFTFLATDLPGRHIVIEINNGVNGLTINYNP